MTTQPYTTRTTDRALRRLAITLLTALLLSGCDVFDNNSDEPDTPQPTVFSEDIITVPFFIEGADKQAPTDDNDLLYEIRTHAPVMAPDGHHVTLGEFSTVRGSVSVACLANGTRVTLNLTGLIPNGVYTIWNVVFDAPGFDPTFAHMSGLGVIGPGDGSQNTVVASADGKASISAITPGGTLSMLGDIATYPLTNNFEWHLVGAYHIDGKSHGPNLGPDGTVAEQFGFIFKQ